MSRQESHHEASQCIVIIESQQEVKIFRFNNYENRRPSELNISLLFPFLEINGTIIVNNIQANSYTKSERRATVYI